jgi:hypothetical protein
MPRRALMPRLLLAAFGSLTSLACGGDQPENPPATGATATSPPAATGASAGARNRCQLDNAQVSAVLGVKVNGPDPACGFTPGDDLTVRPSAQYVAQVTFACREGLPAEAGYTERVEALGTTAYITDKGGHSSVLVCREGDPFEIVVDAAGATVARAAAVALARQVLAR